MTTDEAWDAEQAAYRKGYEWGRTTTPCEPCRDLADTSVGCSCGRVPKGRVASTEEVILRVLTEELPGWDGDYPVSYDELAVKIAAALSDPPGRGTTPEGPTYGTEYLRLDDDREVPVKVCDLCGSLVLLTMNHTEWHASLVTR